MADRPDLSALQLLVAIGERGSVGSAARHLGMAQPNATRSIARLERQLGVNLIVRSTRGSSLSAAGVTIAEHARRTLAAASALDDAAAALRSDTVERLGVAASQTVAEHLMPMWLARLRAHRPDCAVNLHVHNSHDVIDDLRAARVALGFVEDPQIPGDVHSTVVGFDEMVLIVAPHHVWARRRGKVTAQELAGTPLITREAGSGTRIALDRALGAPATPYLELPSIAAVRVATASGAAPAVLSRLAVQDALAAGTLATVPVALDLRRPLQAVWTGPRRLSGSAADLVTIARRESLA